MKAYPRILPMAVLATFILVPAARGLELRLDWEPLAPLPLPLSGHFAGIHSDRLILGGGSNFPVPLFEGGTKVWYDKVYVLESQHGSVWREVLSLPHPLAYAASVSTPKGVFVAGGSDGTNHSREAALFAWEDDRVVRRPLPDLPFPTAYAGAAVVGATVYLYGGREEPLTPTGLNRFLALDLSAPAPFWRELAPPDCPGRILPAMGAQSGKLYFWSGAALVPDASGVGLREYLLDGYRYSPGNGWKPVAPVPVPVVAAPTLAYGDSNLLVLSGDDGRLVDQIQDLGDDHPGFGRKVYSYHTVTDSWTPIADFPPGLVTTQALDWNGRIVVPGGEDRPGHRSDQVHSGRLTALRKGFVPLDYFTVCAYLGLLVWMGFYFSKREKSTDDYFLAGRRIPWWAAGLSIFGTQLSAITFLAIPAKAFAVDWLYFFVNMTIILVAPIVVFFYLPFFRRLEVTTAYEYLERRFNLGARLFGSLTFILFQLGRMGIVLYLPARALSTATGVDIYLCILAMGLLSTLYTVLGGIEAVIWTDVAQVGVLLGGALLSLFLIAFQVEGGFVGIFEMGRQADKFHMLDWGWDPTLAVVWVVVIGQLCANSVPYTSDQSVVQRYLTTKTEAQARNAIWTNAVLTFPASFLFCLVGTGLYAFYKTHPGALDPTLETDAIFPLFIVQQLPYGLAGLVVAGIFAASMSSVDSSLNSLSTVLVTDFYRRLLRPNLPAGDRGALDLARILTLVLGVLATSSAAFMAAMPIQSFMDFYIQLLGFVGGSLAGLFALGIFSKRASGPGAMAGALGGALTVTLVQTFWPVHFFLNATLGMGGCFLIGWIFSLFFPRSDKDLSGLTYWTLKSSREE